MIKKVSILLIFSLFIFLNCNLPVEEEDEKPGKGILFEEDGNNYLQFYYSKDDRYYWWNWYLKVLKTELTTLEVEVKKMSGNGSYGYGIIFNYEDYNNFYVLQIETHKYYSVGRISNGNYSTIKSWRTSSFLNSGYNVVNTIKLVRIASMINIYFNNNYVSYITYNDTIKTNSGFYASIGSKSDENFPEEPVDVRFKMLQPEIIPYSPSDSSIAINESKLFKNIPSIPDLNIQ